MASTEISIKQLPTITSIESGNFVVVQTENATTKLDFKDFVVGLENTTFANVISSSTAGFAGITANTTRSTNNATNIATNAANITTLNTDMGIVSADVISLSSSVGGLNIDGAGGVTFTALTATALSAGSLSAGGNVFKGYPSYSDVKYKTRTLRTGSGDVAVGLDLGTNMNLKFPNSKVKVSFTVTGSVAADDCTAALVVQESDTGTSNDYIDVAELLGDASASAVRGTAMIGTDANVEGETSSFTGIFTPDNIGTGNIIYVRLMLRLEASHDFYQNNSGGTGGTAVNDATGISTLIIEEVFV